ncbi:GMC family oxidoreductase [Beijerinckia sp. L45]|uniref:GMC family oxidoreductase n=1 Tax=Beijerinckia sp. L45 TaxID=1641855 RepID=UPI00131DD2F6|nr:GMC family oxidoreductase [Beijerinckia sp. L45]
MARKLPRKDVVIIGLGWTGSILANDLTDEGLEVVAIERGPWRDTATDFAPKYAADELRYAVRLDLFLQPAQETFTLRHNESEEARPIRQFASFLPGTGVGGAGVHWNGQTWRFHPDDFVLKTHLTERYGAKFLPPNMTIQDWGVTYEDLEPHYDKFEYLCGTSGEAGNLRGTIQKTGNPFEGARSRDYPTPPQKLNYGPSLFATAARELGHQPFHQPSSNLSQPYTNPYGVTLGECTFCGYCERFGCGNYSKASAQTTILPVLMRKSNFEARTECEVMKINLDSTGKKATGVTYIDASGEEWEQPADLVLTCAFMLDNARLMMLSGIGKIYDPKTREGVIGKNFSYQTMSSVQMFFDDKIFNAFMASGAQGMCVDDFNGDNFDHAPHGFVGGGYLGMVQTNARPIETIYVPPGTPSWGAGWKKAAKVNYNSAIQLTGHGSSYSYDDVFLDLDPTYKDRFGRPLMRITFDLKENELKMSAFLTDRMAEFAKAMNPRQIAKLPRKGPYDVTQYQTTHVCGGVIMGTNPTTSAVNRYLQSWDVSNVFVVGASAFPQNAGYNPTDTVGALTYWASKAIREQYLKAPGPLVQA